MEKACLKEETRVNLQKYKIKFRKITGWIKLVISHIKKKKTPKDL